MTALLEILVAAGLLWGWSQNGEDRLHRDLERRAIAVAPSQLPPVKLGDKIFPREPLSHFRDEGDDNVQWRQFLGDREVLAVDGDWVTIRDTFDGLRQQVHRDDVCPPEEAIEFYTRALQAQPDSRHAVMHRALAHEELGHIDAAIADMTATIALQPDYWIYTRRGRLHTTKKDYPAAFADFETAIRLNPDDAWIFLERGQMFAKEGQRVAAVEDFTKALQLNPDYATALRLRAVELFHLTQYDKALRDLDDALSLNPEDSYAHHSRGVVLNRLKRFEESILAFNEVVRIRPNYALVYSNRGKQYRIVRDEARAKADFLKSLELDDTLFRTHEEYAWQLAASEVDEYRNGQLALQHALRACELCDWKDFFCLKTLAAAYAETGDFDKAVETQRRAIAAAPEERHGDYRKKLESYLRKEPIRETPVR